MYNYLICTSYLFLSIAVLTSCSINADTSSLSDLEKNLFNAFSEKDFAFLEPYLCDPEECNRLLAGNKVIIHPPEEKSFYENGNRKIKQGFQAQLVRLDSLEADLDRVKNVRKEYTGDSGHNLSKEGAERSEYFIINIRFDIGKKVFIIVADPVIKTSSGYILGNSPEIQLETHNINRY